MTARSPDPVRRVTRGKIKVDARRAVAQLRQHLLVDLHQYALELTRCAVAGGATRVEVRHDADDVVFAFDGEALAPEGLGRLLDDVLTEAEGPEARRRRHLAVAVNAALGLDPRRVDVLTRPGPGHEAFRARFSPALLDPDAPSPATTPARLPKELGWATTVVEVRARPSLEVLGKAAFGRLPREVSLLAASTHELAIALTLADEPFPRSPRPAALLRFPIEERGLTRGWLEIVPAGSEAPALEMLEHGVLLARYGWTPGGEFPAAPAGGLHLPVRVVADAPELPTNASRSAVREDSPLLQQVLRRSREAFLEAVAELSAIVTGTSPAQPAGAGARKTPGDRLAALGGRAQDRAALEDALGAIAVVVAGAARRGASMPPEAKALLDLPLLRDGVGRPRAPSALAAGSPGLPLYVWRGEAPLPEALAPWMRDVLWTRGRPVEAMLRELEVADAAPVVEQARVGLERRSRLLARPATEPEVPRAALHLARTAFRVTEGELAGLSGEVGLLTLGVEPDEVTTVRAFVEGRELDAFLVPALAVPLRLDVAIAWPERITPRFDYGGVARDRYLALAVLHAARVGVLAADELALRLPRARGLEASALRRVLCAAIGTAVVAAGRLGLEPAESVPIASCRRLFEARCWPTPDGETWLSLRELAAGVQRIGTFHFARPGAAGVTVDGRTVVVASAEEVAWLTAALRPRAAPVPYDRGLLDERGVAAIERDRPALLLEALASPVTREAPAPTLGPRLRFERKGQRGVIAVSSRAQIARLHLGATLSRSAYTPRFGPVAIAIDEEAAVPTAAWDGVIWPGYPSGVLEAERALCAAVVAAVEGNAEGAAGLDGSSPGAPPRRYLLEAASRLKQRLAFAKQPAPADVELLARLEALPILEMLDERGEPAPASLAAVAAAHPVPSLVPVLQSAPGFATLRWRPVVLPESDFLVLGSCVGGRARHAHLELPERERAARIEQARRAFFARPEEDPAVLGAPADPSVAPVHLTSEGSAPVTITAGLASPGSPGAIQALFLRRPLAVLAPERALPIVARVGLVSVEHVRDWAELTDAGRAEVALRAKEGALALATALVGRHGSGVLREPRALALIIALLEEHRLAAERGDAAAGSAPSLDLAVRGSVRWPTVQGGEATLAELRASDGDLYAGPRRFLVWRGPTRGRSELDTPILHLPAGPEGDRLRPLLSSLGLSVRDVGAALEKLQARRGAAGSQDTPRLAGEPAHPALRWSLETLDLAGVEGEVEIVAGPGSEVTLVELDGPRKVDVELPVPMRIVARTEGVHTEPTEAKELLKKITRSAVRQMRELAARLDELPPFVRDHLRALACTAVSRQQRAARAIERAPLFPDIAGACASLEELRADPTAQWAFTTSPPPYPARSYGHRVLRLSADEAKLLAAGLQMKNVTSLLHQDLVGEVRAAVTPLERVGLADERRAECVCVSAMTGPVHGEIGLLAPSHAASRGIALHVGRRPLDLLDDGRGWPIAAAVNADHLKPNRWFNGLMLSSEGAEVSADVRAAADAALRAWIQAPADALEARYLDTRNTSSAGGVLLCGAVWLPALCPRVPRVMVRHGAGVAPGERVAAIAAPPPYLRGHVPIAGELLVMPERGGAMTDDAWAEVAESLRRHAAEMIEAVAARQAAPPSIVAAYRWSLRLVGAEPAVPLEAPLAAGGAVAPEAILAELARTGGLWWTARRGTSEGEFAQDGGSAPKPPGELPPASGGHPPSASLRSGQFPGEAPVFVLLGEGPAFETLRVRLAPEALRELGGDAAGERAHDATALVASAPALRSVSSTQAQPPNDEAAEVAARAANALRAEGGATGHEPEQPSWLAGLVRKAVAIVRPPLVEAPEGDALARALLGAIADLGLPGAPVASIAYTHRGRPLRFDPKQRRLVVRRADPHVGALFERAPTDPRALAILAAAAVGEINRSLEGISDAEERRALQHLLARAGQ